MDVELRFTGMQLRAEGRRLTGVVVRYGDVADLGAFRERIEPGAFPDLSDVMLNLQHDRTRPLARTDGGGMALTDGPEALTMTAELPATRDAEDALALVQSGVLRGLSIGFVPETMRDEGDDLYVIERGRLDHVALVDRPAYEASSVSARYVAALTKPRMRRRRLWL